MKTKVIFRKWHNGEIIAIFPELAGDQSVHSCLSYEHIGQHGSCGPHNVIAQTTPATPSEYHDLATELTAHVGYELKVIKRYNHTKSYDIRKEQYK